MTYRVDFLDFGGNIHATFDIEHNHDEGAIKEAHRMNVLPLMRLGFDVWQSDRLVYRHRN